MTTLAKPSRLVAFEDLKVGQFVTVSHTTVEFICALSEPSGMTSELVPNRATFLGFEAGVPLKVLAICQPFVTVEDQDGELRSLDLRADRLAKVSRRYGKDVFKAARKQRKSGK